MSFRAILTTQNKERAILKLGLSYFYAENTLFDKIADSPHQLLDRLDEAARNRENTGIPFKSTNAAYGGIFEIEVESTADDEDLYQWFKASDLTHGTIRIYNSEDEDQMMRLIEFWDAWLCDIGETMSSTGNQPMIMRFRLSAATVRYNRDNDLKIQRNWWVTDISEQKPSEELVEKTIVSIEWIDQQQKEYIDTIENEQKAYLVVRTRNYNEGEQVSVPVEIEENGKIIQLQGEVNSEGVAYIEWSYKDDTNKKQ